MTSSCVNFSPEALVIGSEKKDARYVETSLEGVSFGGNIQKSMAHGRNR